MDAEDQGPRRQDEVHPRREVRANEEDRAQDRPGDDEPLGMIPVRLPIVVVERMNTAPIRMA